VKTSKFLKRGLRIFFTLALFLLVFAAASVVKIQAAGNVMGWLWGGGTESDGSAPWDDANTNVGWISLNRTNCDSDNNGTTDTGNYANCPSGASVADYGVNIPSSDGNVTGYAWSENIGWISFNAADLTSCPTGTCSARREGDYLKGWARIIAIKDAAASSNSGGWEGWLSLNDKTGSNYGVQISKMDGTGNNPTYAWSASSSGSGELGWIDFSRATYEEPCSIDITSSMTITAGQTGTLAISRDRITNSSLTVSLTSSDTSKVTVPASATISANRIDTTVDATALPFSGGANSCTDGPFQITATACSMSKPSDITVKRSCSISCSPDKTDVVAGGSANFKAENNDFANSSFGWTYTGETGCVDSGSASGSGNSSYEIVTKTQDSNGKSCAYKKINVTASGSCCGSDICELNLGRAGWIETNP